MRNWLVPWILIWGLFGNFCVCIQTQSNLVIIIIIIISLLLRFFSLWACPTKFSETNDPIFTKIHREIDTYLKRCTQVLKFSKWPPLPWKLSVCQNLWPHLYRKPPKGFPQNLAYILRRVGRIFWPKKIASEWPPIKSAKFQCSLISMKIYI